MSQDLTAVVTGGGSGIGAATARGLAAEGFDVVVVGRREGHLGATVKAITEAGGTARAVVLDVTDQAAVDAFARRIESCDVLINNAGGAFGVEPVAEARSEDWTNMFQVNVIGSLNVTRALMPRIRRSPHATVVNLGSTAGEITYEGGGGYTAAKHAVHAMTETLRLELAGTQVRVVEIMPGMVMTDEFSTIRYRGDASQAEALYANVDRPLVAEDIARCITFCVALPQHVNVDRMVLRPVAQAAQHKLYRGPIPWSGEDPGEKRV